MFRSARLAPIACCALVLSAAGRNPWLRIRSANFEVFTTAGERNGRDLARHFEQVRSFFIKAFGAAPVEARPVRVIAFHNDQEYLPYRPSEVAAAFYAGASYHDLGSGRVLTRDYIVMSRADGEFYPAAVHEYVHLLVRQSGLKIPLWMNEGLAELYSTLDSAGAWQVAIGKAPLNAGESLDFDKWIDLRTLVETGQDSPLYNAKAHAGLFYAECWALTHMLTLDERYRPGHKALMDAFSAGEGTVEAFQRAYGKSIEQMQKDLREYVKGDRMRIVLVDLQWDNVAEAPEISGGSPAAELALAEMTAAMPGRSGQAIESYAQLSRDYPTVWEVEAGWGETLLVHGKTGEAAPHFARAVDLGCHDVSVFLEYSQALMAERRNDEAVSVLKTAAKLSPAPGDVHRQLGMALALTANYPEALREFAQAGNVAASDAARFFYTFAYAYYRTGNKPLARETLAKAAACAKTAPEKTMIDGLRESLDSDAARPADPSFDASQVPHAEPGPPRLVRRNPAPEGSLPAPPKPEPLKVAEGALQAVDCNAKLLRLLVADSAVVLRILDPEKVVVKSADGGSLELTCGPQKAKRVRVEFDAPPGLSPGIAGVVRSIEFP